MAQGTIRPISERAYFMVFRELFDLDALPYRLLVLFTQFGSLILLNRIACRLTGSAAGGLLAAMLWCSNSVLFWPMSWTSAYNQILCAFTLLLALFLFIRYTETGNRKYNYWQWVVFLLGFGVLEENVVYPALTLAYAFFFARNYLRSALWLTPASIVYASAHHYFAKASHEGVYAVELGAKTLPALLQYWILSLWPEKLSTFVSVPQGLAISVVALLSAAFAAYLFLKGRNQPCALFGIAWFLVSVAPYLLVPNHVSEYYLTVPTIGLALFASIALLTSWKEGFASRTFAVLLTAIHVVPSGYSAWISCQKVRMDSTQIKSLVFGVDQLKGKKRNQNIFLEGIDDQLFTYAFFHHPFRLVGIHRIYLTPENAVSLAPWDGMTDFSEYALPAAAILRSIETGTGVVLRFANHQLIDTTNSYTARLRERVKEAGPPTRIDPGSELFDPYLTSGWYQAEARHRWMSQRAVFTIGGLSGGGLSTPGHILHLTCSCAEVQQRDAPFRLSVTINGKQLPTVQIPQCGSALEFKFPIPEGGGNKMEVVLALDKVSKLDFDKRLLGLAIQRIEVR